jgi:integrase
MRENEICQLHTADVGDWEGGLYLEIRLGDDRRLKNRPSKRTIPVHPEVFKFGFREYVAMRRRAADSPRLFPDLTMASTGSYSDNFSKWFGNFLLKVFGRKIEATFHNFRHTFTSACRAVDISPQRIDSLCGWAGGGRQQRKYGVAAPVSALAEDLNRVSFNGLDLSHLYLPQVQEVAITARTRVRPTKESISP